MAPVRPGKAAQKDAAKDQSTTATPAPTTSPKSSAGSGDIPSANMPAGDKAGQDPSESLFVPSQFQSESAAIRAVAVQVIDVMQKWLLPLLYGPLAPWCSSCARFPCRPGTGSSAGRISLSRLARLPGNDLRPGHRWFWGHDPEPTKAGGAMTLSTLSPFALAFIAGYGVELFFALLDKIVSTFTNKA